MKKLLLILALALSGCGITPQKPDVVFKTIYVVRTAPAELKMVPPVPPKLAANATNTQVATWIVDTEERLKNLETQIRKLVEFYEAPVTEEKVK